MDKKNIDYTLYLCTDRELMSCETVEKSVRLAVEGGVSVVQLREKNISSREFLKTALMVKEITAKKNIPLIINDRIDICLAAGADGVHLGQSDIPCKTAREILGEEKIIGVSAHNAAEALEAEREGADYLGVGAAFVTHTKSDARPISRENIREIRAAVKIPFVVIGGINSENIKELYGFGINGAAVVSAVIAKPDITQAAKIMRKAAEGL